MLPFFWSGLRDSNSLPPPWQGGALPDELNPQVFLNHKEIIHNITSFVNTEIKKLCIYFYLHCAAFLLKLKCVNMYINKLKIQAIL